MQFHIFTNINHTKMLASVCVQCTPYIHIYKNIMYNDINFINLKRLAHALNRMPFKNDIHVYYNYNIISFGILFTCL